VSRLGRSRATGVRLTPRPTQELDIAGHDLDHAALLALLIGKGAVVQAAFHIEGAYQLLDDLPLHMLPTWLADAKPLYLTQPLGR
jgi:hypothetical protein